MTFQANISEFAEFVGTEIKRIENKISEGGSSQSSGSMIITGNGRQISLRQHKHLLDLKMGVHPMNIKLKEMSRTELSIVQQMVLALERICGRSRAENGLSYLAIQALDE